VTWADAKIITAAFVTDSTTPRDSSALSGRAQAAVELEPRALRLSTHSTVWLRSSRHCGGPAADRAQMEEGLFASPPDALGWPAGR